MEVQVLRQKAEVKLIGPAKDLLRIVLRILASYEAKTAICKTCTIASTPIFGNLHTQAYRVLSNTAS